MLDKRLLKRMQFAVLCESFNGYDIASVNFFYRFLTGKHGFIIDQHRASAAQSLAATIFNSCQRQIRAQHPQQRSTFIDLQVDGFAI
jgi:hypothetical protein